MVGSKRHKFWGWDDRISGLPDSILEHILSLLPSTRDAIRTSVLSKRWHNLWSHVPLLKFITGDENDGFIDDALILHSCRDIKKLCLNYDFDSDPRFNMKIRFAARKCVGELILSFDCDNEWYMLPKSVFDNAWLVKLELVNCHFEPDWRVHLPSLKSLKMNCDDGSCSKGVENAVSTCPLLERLEFHGNMLGHVAIVSKSLKVLSFVDVVVPNAITICCPNLLEFYVVTENEDESTFPVQIIENVLSGSPLIHSLKLVDCYCDGLRLDKLVIASKSLKVLRLHHVEGEAIEASCPNLEKLDVVCVGLQAFKTVNLPSLISISLYTYLPYFLELLDQIRQANKLTIGGRLFEDISKLYSEDSNSLPLLNSKCLTLDAITDFLKAVPGIAYALRSRVLETLVIHLEFRYHTDVLDKEYWNAIGCSAFPCLESHLKTVKIIGKYREDYARCKRVFEFIKFLLENARVLENMTVLLVKPPTEFVVKLSKKLLSFPRYSRGAIVELCST